MSRRVLPVAMNVEFPALLLASMQILTIRNSYGLYAPWAESDLCAPILIGYTRVSKQFRQNCFARSPLEWKFA
jgi:hypothetical protein